MGRSWRANLVALVALQSLTSITAMVLATINGLAGLAIASDSANAIASLVAGVLLHSVGWQAMNQVAIPFLLLVIGLRIGAARRRAARPAALPDA